MTPIELMKFINSGESQEVEFKQSFHSFQEISKAICAFANTHGGYLILGVTDKKQIIGLSEDHNQVQQQISSSVQSITPPPLISIQSYTLEEKQLIVISVPKATTNSFHTYNGAIYVRVGSTTKRLDGHAYLEFLRNKQLLLFEEAIVPEATLENIDTEQVQSYLNIRNQHHFLRQHSLEQFLLSSKLAINNNNLHLKNAALLLFGNNISEFIPQAEIKLVQFSGTEAVNIVTHKLIQENLIESFIQSVAFITKTLSKSIDIKGAGPRIETYEYPLHVIREAIVNALAHRDYFSYDAIQIYIFDNRIEITSPGSLPYNLSKELFGSLSVRRNPTVYRFLRDLGFVEGLGTGVPRMKHAMREAKLPDPQFIITDSFFRVILYNSSHTSNTTSSSSDLLTLRQEKVIKYTKDHKHLKAATYAKMNNISYGTAINDINHLIKMGYLKKIGTYKGAYYVLS